MLKDAIIALAFPRMRTRCKRGSTAPLFQTFRLKFAMLIALLYLREITSES
jgi:hypothetical protein